MKILIAYYSKTGNTERVAKELASRLDAEIEKIIDKKNRKGIFGFLSGGRDAMKKQKTEIGPISHNPSGYDLVVFGTPIWASSMTPAIRTYLEENRAKIRQWAFFLTSGSTEAEQIVGSMEEVLGARPVAHLSLTAKELPDREVYERKIASFVERIKAI